MSTAFDKLAPYIKDYIYYNNWTELREVQISAINVILDTQNNLLLSSGTASGKTEAAFLPVLTDLDKNPSTSVGVLYISPLKALINDQFLRLEKLLEEAHVPVCKWHGDASQTKKHALIKKPEGILQITPESLESLLINRRPSCHKLFHDLRYVIIDEVHSFMRDVRGVQVLCLLERLQNISGCNPRRIGLSATLGDIDVAVNWLSTGSNRKCSAPISTDGKKNIMLYVERFLKADPTPDTEVVDANRLHYEYLFKMTLNKKTIVFTNSREETELVMSNLREIAVKNKAPNVYRVHHGNVSALLREQTEDEMKNSEDKIVTGATVTLELGIDIGSLDQVVQVGAPINVASFAQRLGRCGRRGQVPRLLFTFVEEVQTTAADDVLGTINWAFVRLIAIVELYTKQKWIEPISPQHYPYSLLYHQTMSSLKSAGELSAAKLASDILNLSCFKYISQEDYRLLLAHLLEIEHIERTENGGLIIGRRGEGIVNNFNFYAVFTVPVYYMVKDENRSIGTVDKIYPVGTRFSLAGMTWETLEINDKGKVIFVKKVPGISVVDWDVDFKSELHTVLVRKIKSIMESTESYKYLSPSCSERLNEIRNLAKNSGILTNLVTQLSKNKFAIFPWVGTRQLFSLHYALLNIGLKSKIPWETCVFLEVIYEGTVTELEHIIREIISSNIDAEDVALPDKTQVMNKYNNFIPPSLLKKQYALDFLNFKSLHDDFMSE